MSLILLVDDHEMAREIMQRRLEREGHTVTTAQSGKEALEMISERLPDVVLMDMSMPMMDGWEASRRIKADPNFKKIPIMALTANAIEGDRERCLAAGCDDYESKPVDFDRLLKKIRLLLSGHRA
ncbi:MAG: response regulator [Leptospirales bacterium]|jgi:two-component system cell cycle response regulator DivK